MSGAAYVNEASLTDGVITRRVVGALIDGVLMGVVLAALHLVFWLLGFLTFGLGWFLAGGLWVVPLFYVFVFVGSPGQATPGQALTGLRVVRDEDLGRPTPAQALVYAVCYAVTIWAGAIWLVAAFFTRRARCLHDIVSGVVVVRAEALPVLTPVWTMPGGLAR